MHDWEAQISAKPFGQGVSASITPQQVAAIVSQHVDVALGHDWGWLLGWLSQANGIDADQWREAFAAALDVGLLVERVADDVADKLAGAVDFTNSLSSLAPLASAECIHAVAPTMISRAHPSLPARAGKSFRHLFGTYYYAVRAAQERPTPNRSNTGKIQVYPAVNPEIDARAVARVLLAVTARTDRSKERN